jgi:hypothetical protein
MTPPDGISLKILKMDKEGKDKIFWACVKTAACEIEAGKDRSVIHLDSIIQAIDLTAEHYDKQ